MTYAAGEVWRCPDGTLIHVHEVSEDGTIAWTFGGRGSLRRAWPGLMDVILGGAELVEAMGPLADGAE